MVWANDIDSEKGEFHYNFGNLPEDWIEQFDAVVLDPPYLLTGGFKTLKDSIDRGYGNRERASRGIKGVVGVVQMYAKGALEAHRVLKPKGIFIVKTMDQIESGKQQWLSIRLITLFDLLGFDSVDWFVITMPGMPTMRHDKQDHARRNHSYFLVFRKRGKWGR
jgi:DNA modification methylase